MQGSFTSESADKFLQLMREAGYEVSKTVSDSKLKNFSELSINPGAVQGDVWSGNFANFGEVRGEYIENYDYTRCVRPDGSAYGTKGKCRKGTEQAKEVPSLKAKPQPKVKPQPKAKPQPHPEVEPNPKESYSSLMNQQLSLVIKGDLKGAMALSDKINEARDKYTKTPEAMAQQKKIEEEAVKKLSSRDAEKAAKDARDNAQLNAKLTAKDKKSPQ